MLLVATDHGLGRVVDDTIEILALPYADVTALIRDAGSLEPAREAGIVDKVDVVGAHLLCPLSRPLAIWGIGLNYHSKATVTGRPVPTMPILFVKPDTALTGPGDVPIPAVPSEELDYEAEVALIIGKTLTAADPAGSPLRTT
jgi:2-keto-4-pentenoate hydratase/2-oxohepta-3-ene-1,7-dioic acid hydratase in catechol pathway